MSNYPPGAANDPNAPYNIPDVPKFKPEKKDICSKCGDEEAESCDVNEDGLCENCYYEES